MDNVTRKSIIMAMTLGDGCLYRSSPSQANKTGYFACKHGHKQKDYVEWKAKLVAHVMERPVNVRETFSKVKALNKTYQQYCFLVGKNDFRSWRNQCYPNNVKSFDEILMHIEHPVLTLAMWLMDDGTVMTAPFDKRVKGGPRICSGLVLFLGECFNKDAYAAKDWFEKTFNVHPRLKWQKVKYKGAIKAYPELRFTVQDALYLWKHISKMINSIPSMKYKFRLLEDRANRSDLVQPQTLLITDINSDDIVQKVFEINK